jgi:predicted DCC family thiol-disulfide oxidoreductase YuxK
VTDDPPQDESASELAAHPILLYDGVCGLCNRMVQFVLRRDPAAMFRFAALQSELATRILKRHGADARDLDTVYVVVNYELADEQLLSRSDAVSFILQHMGAAELRSAPPGLRPGPTQATPTPTIPRSLFWRVGGLFLRVIPRSLRDWGYRIVARNRYRMFGRYDSCPIPTAGTRSRFLT